MTDEPQPPAPLPRLGLREVHRARRDILTAALDAPGNAIFIGEVNDILNDLGARLAPHAATLGREWLARATAELAGLVADVVRALVSDDVEVADKVSALVRAYELADIDNDLFAEEQPEDVVAAAESLLRNSHTDEETP
jgi:hypothetical protein